MRSFQRPLAFLACLFPIGVLFAQQSRIATRIDNGQTMLLHGHVRPEARAQYDQGSVEPTFVLPTVTLHLKPSAQQRSALEQLLAEQQDPTSANYHKWLTPEQYADRFGVSADDLQKITEWLQSQGFTISNVARGGRG